MTYVADLVGRRLDELDEASVAVIESATRLHPGRWQFVLRDEIAKGGSGQALRAAQLLEPIGDRSDISRLRQYARRQNKVPGASQIGRRLARQLADRVFVEDQVRVSIHIGERNVHGSMIRRKVLALLCFLSDEARHDEYARPSPRRPVARSRSCGCRELAESNGVLPSPRAGRGLRRRPFARVPTPRLGPDWLARDLVTVGATNVGH